MAHPKIKNEIVVENHPGDALDHAVALDLNEVARRVEEVVLVIETEALIRSRIGVVAREVEIGEIDHEVEKDVASDEIVIDGKDP